MIYDIDILFVTKYALCIILLIGVILAPSWIARQNGHGKPKMQAVRIASWIWGWSIIAWLYSIIVATRK